MALYRRYLTPSISSAVNSSLSNLFSSPNAATATATAVRSLSSLPKSSILNGPHSSYTWLLHPYSQSLHSVEHRGIPFYPKSLAINNIPESAARCVGSTRGWLCLADPKGRSLYLSQPFSNKSIKLPNTSKSYVFTNFTLSSSEPDSDENCILTAIKSDMNKTGISLVYCRPRKDNAWRDGPYNGSDRSFDHLVYSGYDHMFYTLTLGHEGCIRAWKVNYKSMELHNANVWFFSKQLIKHYGSEKISQDLWGEETCGSKSYLVIDEASGDFFLVMKIYVKHVVEDGTVLYKDPTGTFPYKTQAFEVFKVDFNWGIFQELKSIGDRVLFLGLNESFCLYGSKHMGLKRDSIYFTDDFVEKIYSDKYPYGGHDMGVYSLKNNSMVESKSCSFFAGLQEKKKIEETMVWVAPSTQLLCI